MGVLIAFCHGFGLCGCPGLFCLALLLCWWLLCGWYYFPLFSGDVDGSCFPAPLNIFAFCWRSFRMASLSLCPGFWACFQWLERDLSLGSYWPEVKWVLFYAWVWYSFSSSSVSLNDLSEDVVAGV